jgi:hypothetical protein
MRLKSKLNLRQTSRGRMRRDSKARVSFRSFKSYFRTMFPPPPPGGGSGCWAEANAARENANANTIAIFLNM